MSRKGREHPGYEYQEVNTTLTPYEALEDKREPTIVDAANYWQSQGWETVSVIPPKGEGYAYTLLVKRTKQNPYNMSGSLEEWHAWQHWNDTYGED